MESHTATDTKATSPWGSRGKRTGFISASFLQEDETLLSSYLTQTSDQSDRRFSEASIRSSSPLVSINSLSDIPLDPNLLENSYRISFNICTAIQRVSIPIMISASNLLACDRVQYGRKEGYILSIIQNMLASGPPEAHSKPVSLIVGSTIDSCELAYKVCRLLSHRTGIRILSCHKAGFSIDSIASCDTDIMILTHSMIQKLINLYAKNIIEVRYLVIDEVNEMISDEQSLNGIYVLMKHACVTNQSKFYIFGSILPVYISNMMTKYSLEHIHISIGPLLDLFKHINQHFIQVSHLDRYTLLYEILCSQSSKTLIFEDKAKLPALSSFLSSLNFNGKVLLQSHLLTERKSISTLLSSASPCIIGMRDLDAIFFNLSSISTIINLSIPSSIDFYISRIIPSLSSGSVFTLIPPLEYILYLKEFLQECSMKVPEWM
jgi:superfamily II DNA/RNA helicase